MPEGDPVGPVQPAEPAGLNDEVVPKLPRGRGLKLSMPEIVRILMTGGLLVALIVLIKPCSKSVSTFVMGFGSGSGSARGRGAGSAKVDPYEHLTPGMSDAEVRLAIERAKLKNIAAQQAVGSAAVGSAAVGSAAKGSAPKPLEPVTGSATESAAGSMLPAPVQPRRGELAPGALPAPASSPR